MSMIDTQVGRHLTLPAESGVYMITNVRTGKIYVGQSQNIRRRAVAHISELKRNKHASKAIQSDWNSRLSDDEFEFSVYVLCDQKLLRENEKNAIKKIAANGNCYNELVFDEIARKRSIDTTAAARQAAHRERKRGAGVVELRGVWVPAELAEQARKAVAELVEQHKGRQ